MATRYYYTYAIHILDKKNNLLVSLISASRYGFTTIPISHP